MMQIDYHVDYNEISHIYDEVRQAETTLVSRFLREIAVDHQTRILDLGCGTGTYTDMVQRLTGAKVYGVEPALGMLEKAQQKNSEVLFKPGCATYIPFVAGFFDFIYLIDVIHHIQDVAGMFAELQRGLKVGGKVCIVTQSWQQIDNRPISQFFPKTATIDKQRYAPETDLITLAQQHGLQWCKTETHLTDEQVELDGQFLDLVQKKGFSMLHFISDVEYETGLQRLKTRLAAGNILTKPAGETLLWFVKE